MGLRFRKSIKLGPVRINLSKSGIGWSIGTKGARFTKKAGGGYRTTVGVPGTGITYAKDYSVKTANKVSSQQKEPKREKKHVTPEQRKKKTKTGVALGAGIAVLVLAAICWKLIGSSNFFQSNIVFTETISDDIVWETGSRIQFTKYPGKCKPGDKVLVEIKAEPSTYYAIVVYDTSGVVNANTLVGTNTNATGKANWSWSVSEESLPGIYYIQVSDRSGNKNCIDYYIIDQDGNVVGDPPSRENPIIEEDQSFTIEIEDIEYASGQGQMVYIAETGSKYHKSTCHHVSAGATAIDLNTALAQGYSACQDCY